MSPRSHKVNVMSITDLETAIKQHNAAVNEDSRNRVCYRESCAACGENATFAACGRRSRGLRYAVGNTVVCVIVWLARWQCDHCRRRFTDYPNFCSTV